MYNNNNVYTKLKHVEYSVFLCVYERNTNLQRFE